MSPPPPLDDDGDDEEVVCCSLLLKPESLLNSVARLGAPRLLESCLC